MDRRTWPQGRSETILATLTLLVVLAATWLAYNARLPIQIEAGDEVRQVFFGFHAIERTPEATFRWTAGASRVCFDQLGGVPRSGVELRLLGGYALPLGIDTVTVLANDQPIVTLPLTPAPRRYHLLLGEALARADDSCLTLSSQVALAPDQSRLLGVPLAGLTLQPLPAGQPTRPALLQLALNLALAALALWLGHRAGAPPVATAAGVIGATLLLTAALLGRWTTPGTGLVRSLLPLTAGLTLIGAAALAGDRLHRRLCGAPRLLLISDLLGLICWAALLYGLTRAFQLLLGVSGMWPMKAGVQIAPAATVAAPLALCAGWVGLHVWAQVAPVASRGGGIMTTPRARRVGAAALIALGGVLLPVALKASVLGWDSLFATFTNNPYEYISDVGRVGADPLGFLQSYVKLAPTLALHSSTHPPGAILLLWAVGRAGGPGPAPASLVAIGLSSGLGLAALWLGGRLGGLRLGLLAGAITVVMPGHQIYSVTSMDGVFNSLIASGAVALLLCLEPGARPRSAALAGALIAAALFFTYATTQLAFFGLGVAAVALLRRGAGTGGWREAALPALRQGLIAAGVVAGSYLLLYLLTGFNVVAGALGATAHNAAVMRGLGSAGGALRAFVPPDLSYYTMHLVANLLPFAWYLGPWGIQGAAGAGRRAWVDRPIDGLAALAAGLAALVGGMLLSGLFNREVERIWGFAYPLLAVLIGAHVLQGATRWERGWRVGLYLGLFAAHSIFIRAVLNTFW